MMRESPVVDFAVLALVNGFKVADLITACRERFALDERKAAGVIRRARRMLCLAALVDQEEAIGTAIQRLNDCYKAARAADPPDWKTCIRAQRELNLLLGLDRPMPASSPAESRASAELARARHHLAALKLSTDEKASIDELARLAAAAIIESRIRTAARTKPGEGSG